MPEDSEDPETQLFARLQNAPMLRCQCGHIYSTSIPTRCACGELKGYWQTLDGRILKLSEMTLGHLNNTIRMLAAKVEKTPMDERGKYEIALDILYAELGSRDQEISQATGIMAALQRSLDRAAPED